MNIDDTVGGLEPGEDQVLEKHSHRPSESNKIAEDSRLRSLEIDVFSDRERRERCLRPLCHGENTRVTNQLKEIQRSEEIRTLLAKKSPVSVEQECSKSNQFISQNSKIYKFVSEARGVPLSITSALNGDRVYCASEIPKKPLPLVERYNSKSSLLSISVEEMREKMEKSKLHSPLPYHRPKEDERICWVTKYAPTSFSDLITDDRVNREFVKWLKNWKTNTKSMCSIEKTKTPLSKKSSPDPTSKKTPFKDPSSKITDFFSSPSKQTTSKNATPSTKAAQEKVMILCGALGVGKTCLVKAGCRICGYLPFTIDASHDRSPTALEQTLSDVLSMDSLYGKRQPRCILFEEIDTLPTGIEGKEAIRAIMSFIQGAHSKISPLRFPMIFICNEIHAPYLLPMRKIAKILYIPQPKLNKSLVTRLQKICALEKVKIDLPELHKLVEDSRNDISSCLNTLQFQSRCQQANSSSFKTLKVSPFTIWESILLSPYQQRESFLKLCHLYETFGEYTLILSGIFANYCNLRIQDGYLAKSKSIVTMISDASQLVWKLPNYCVFWFLAIQRLTQAPENRKIRTEWPRKEFEIQKLVNKNSKTIWSLFQELPTFVKSQVEQQSLSLDYIPFLNLMHPRESRCSNLETGINIERTVSLISGKPINTPSLHQDKASFPRLKRSEMNPESPLSRKERRQNE